MADRGENYGRRSTDLNGTSEDMVLKRRHVNVALWAFALAGIGQFGLMAYTWGTSSQRLDTVIETLSEMRHQNLPERVRVLESSDVQLDRRLNAVEQAARVGGRAP